MGLIEDTNRNRLINEFISGNEVDSEVYVIRNPQNRAIIRLHNSKCFWKAKNHASSALTNEFKTNYPKDYIIRCGFKHAGDLKDYILNNKILIIEKY